MTAYVTLEVIDVRQSNTPLCSREIKELQHLLRQQYYIVGPLDGIYGRLTQLAVIRYQKSSGRSPTGIANQNMLQELRGLRPIQIELPADLLHTQSAMWVELDKLRLTLFVNGQYSAVYLVAIGKPSTPSPFGLWRVVNRAINPGGDFGARWLGIDAPWGSYGVHGSSRPELIGKQVSNGCVRMYNADVCEVFEHMFVGTRVLFTGNPYGTKIFKRELRQGDMGSDVFLLQENLIKEAFLKARPDGIFGGATELALREYQYAQSLAGTGVFDKATKLKMFGG